MANATVRVYLQWIRRTFIVRDSPMPFFFVPQTFHISFADRGFYEDWVSNHQLNCFGYEFH